MSYPVLSSEAERLGELKSLGILDSAPSRAFDSLVEAGRQAFGVPICLVSIIDEKRQWFKAVAGLDRRQTDRVPAFCNYTILGDEVFVVEDATRDPRFASNPLVTGPPGICFYAGAPLRVTSGHALGSLCIIDHAPRTLSPAEAGMLKHMAVVVTALVENQRAAKLSLWIAEEAEEQRELARTHSRRIRIRERQFMQTERLAKVGGWELSLPGNVLIMTDETYRIHGLPLGSVVTSETITALQADPDRFAERRRRAIMDGIGYDEEFEIVTAAGERKWLRVACDAERVGGVTTRLFGMAQDVTHVRAAQHELWRTANHDALTGLANRARFTARIEDAFARREAAGRSSRAAIGLLMVDVDHLKEVNDTLGHAAGDALLCEVAQRLERTIGESGHVARIGGDEFVVLMGAGASEAQLAETGAAIVAAMQPSLPFDGEILKPRVSIGGAVAAAHDTARLLRQKADLALYACKRSRRGLYQGFREDMRQATLHRVASVRNVGEALAENRIFPHYQPLTRLETGEIIAFEALARMRTPDGRIVAAGDFHEALEDQRIARALTGRMISQVAADARRWLDAGLPLQRVGINFATADFQAGDICERVAHEFGRHDVPLKHVVIEVTEMVFMNGNEAAVVEDLNRLRADGLYVALDDFGTGYASLNHLRTLPVDVLKIDKSFVRDMLADPKSGLIVEGVVDLGRKLGLNVVAEGIERPDQAEHLRRLGCHLGQGFLFGRPSAPAKAASLLRRFGEPPGGHSRVPVEPASMVA